MVFSPSLIPPYILVCLLTLSNFAFSQETHKYTVISNQPPALVIYAGDDLVSSPGETVTLGGNPVASGGTPPYNYSWTPSDDLSDHQVANPNITMEESDVVYTFTVSVTDAAGCTLTDMLNVSVEESEEPDDEPETPDITTSLPNDPEPSFVVYPNPVKGKLTIKSNQSRGVLTVLDSKGNLILKRPARVGVNTIDTSHWTPGLYLLKIDMNRKTRTVKVLVQ